MANCSSALPRTQFLGATISQFQASLGWNGGQGELTAMVIQDDCVGGGVAYADNGNGVVSIASKDFFNPPPLGSPVTFRYGGFSFSGILQNWKEDDSASGVKAYTLRVIDAREILDGTQIILNGYIGDTYNMPNLVNVFGWLEEQFGTGCPEFTASVYPPQGFNVVLRYHPALAYGGADDRGGLPWWQIRVALTFLLNQTGNKFGGKLLYRGHYYGVDLSDLPNLDDWIRFNADNMSLADIIHEVCELSSYDYFYTLVNHNMIKVNVVNRSSQSEDHTALAIDTAVGTNITQRLDQGTIGGVVGGISGLESKSRGVELRQGTTNAFLTGEYRQDVWQTMYMGGDSWQSAAIWPYWGKDLYGNVLPSYGIAWHNNPIATESWVDVPVDGWGIPGFTGTWRITTTELRFALEGETMWRNFVLARQPALCPNLYMSSENEMPDLESFHGKCWQRGVLRPPHFAAASRAQAEAAAHEGVMWENFSQVFEHIQQYASTYFGKKFMVKLPYLCSKISADTPYTIQTNWQVARDGGWFEGHCLGLMPGSPELEHFRTEDGKVVAFMGFQCPAPLDMSFIGNKDDYIQINPYTAYVKVEVEGIEQVAPGDWRAIVTLPGMVSNYAPHSDLNQILGVWAMLRVRYGINKVTDEALWNIGKTPGADSMQYRLHTLPLLPLAAAIPLQSTRLVYGPWGAGVVELGGVAASSAGKTDYQRNSDFAPWNFGSVARMNAAGTAYCVSRVSDHYVVEQGAITIPDAPQCSLGQALFSGGPLVNHMDIRIGADSSPITTQYQMKTYTPDYGKISQQYISAIKRNGIMANKINRWFRTYSLDKSKSVLDFVDTYWKQRGRWNVRYSASSSHDILVGGSLLDPENNQHSQTHVAMSELRKALPSLVANDPQMYASRALMDLNGLIRPFGTSPQDRTNARLPTFENAGSTSNTENLKSHSLFYSYEQTPPILCQESHLPVVMETLSPFLKDNKSVNGLLLANSGKGHDIEYVARDAYYPTHLSIRQANDGYSASHQYRAFALRGPLIIAGWGYDIDNKPVPNASAGYPNNAVMRFEDDWLRKPQNWKVGPVDLRWDYRRKVWTAPSPHKIIKVYLEGPALPGYATIGFLNNEATQYDNDGYPISQPRVPVWNIGGRPIPPGVTAYAYWDTTDQRYNLWHSGDVLFEVRMTYGMSPGSMGMGQITGALGCNANVANKTAYVTSSLGQPVCPGRLIYGYWIGAVPTQYTNLCGTDCVMECIYYVTPVQAQFEPLVVVTNIEFLECSGYDWETVSTCVKGGINTPNVNIACSDGNPDDEYDLCNCYCEGWLDQITHNLQVPANPVQDHWKYYKLCVHKRRIYLQAAYSPEEATTLPYGNTSGSMYGFDCMGVPAQCNGMTCDRRPPDVPFMPCNDNSSENIPGGGGSSGDGVTDVPTGCSTCG